MDTIKKLSPFYAVSSQISVTDIGAIAAAGYQTVINNRPDGEAEDQPNGAEIKAAVERQGMVYIDLPVKSGNITDEDVAHFTQLMAEMKGPVLAFCRTGTRSTSLWALHEACRMTPEAVLSACADNGYEVQGLLPRLQANFNVDADPAAMASAERRFDVLIIGGGAAGIATAASLLCRNADLNLAIIEPKDKHYYQPGWTLVGGGAFERKNTERAMADVMPAGVKWIHAAASGFEPEQNRVILEDGERLGYRCLVVAPGIKLNWDAIEGLSDTLGQNGVTSNYYFDMASYTWELVQSLKSGTALFTQPPMPIKCAGAPQKAMYLSSDHWQKQGVLKDIDVQFNTAGAVLFGVDTFVPPLMKYIDKYGIDLRFNSNLVKVDGGAKTALFKVTDAEGNVEMVEKPFDMMHVCPPQIAPDFIRNSPLADAGGWVEVSPETLQHVRYSNIFGCGDVSSSPNAKTAAAVRKQAPVVAENVLATLDGKGARAIYDGYGSCPLTVERGKVILAEFGYGGKLLPTFPLDPTKPRKSMWWLKEKHMPNIYFDMMLKGREYLAKPEMLPHDPVSYETQQACDFNDSKK
ncbi:MAG: bifunctional protein tyrosine phosphatase family protein/NAD(P)/FAD-dependent oxidoreductase [Motiliproteus sp.]|nr:bifunctional protein tyrosine phosphatase family protein/NAD(P)/FAD-dependent oxidoreductase [Motiliproteus sp.]MCW9052899.1 bifunctional protein tyrosine phosphatase family protein/NAD(P)/FAD-dependent oxidoreductase [Motiliproteus sp.]